MLKPGTDPDLGGGVVAQEQGTSCPTGGMTAERSPRPGAGAAMRGPLDYLLPDAVLLARSSQLRVFWVMASWAICLADGVTSAAREVSIQGCTLACPCSWYSRACRRQSSLSASRAHRASRVSPASYSATAAEIILATTGGSAATWS